MPPEVVSILQPIIGLPNCRTDVGERKSLSLGFGERVFHQNERLRTQFYGEWEVGTYYSAWRVIKGATILLARGDEGTSNDLAARLEDIPLGTIAVLVQSSPRDLRLEFNTGVIVEVLADTSKPDEECFHIFLPGKKYMELSAGGVWTLTDSDKPEADSNPIRFTGR